MVSFAKIGANTYSLYLEIAGENIFIEKTKRYLMWLSKLFMTIK